METVSLALERARQCLAAAGIAEPRREARLLLALALECGLAEIFARSEERLAAPGFDRLVARRAAREPFAYLSGQRGFWTLDLAVTPAVLIPRPESETLIEAALAARPERERVKRIFDLGTGSGALLLAALAEFPAAWGIGVDRSEAALAVALANARQLGFASRAAFVAGDWAGAIGGRFDLVLANPPYIPSAEIEGLMTEVARYEPRAALDGGTDGLAAYETIFSALPRLLAENGVAVVEVGKARPIAALARQAGFSVAFRADQLGQPRALVLTTPPKKLFGRKSR